MRSCIYFLNTTKSHVPLGKGCVTSADLLALRINCHLKDRDEVEWTKKIKNQPIWMHQPIMFVLIMKFGKDGGWAPAAWLCFALQCPTHQCLSVCEMSWLIKMNLQISNMTHIKARGFDTIAAIWISCG